MISPMMIHLTLTRKPEILRQTVGGAAISVIVAVTVAEETAAVLPVHPVVAAEEVIKREKLVCHQSVLVLFHLLCDHNQNSGAL